MIGHTSSFKAKEKRELRDRLAPFETGERGSGDPSRWDAGRELEWITLRPELVVEVSYDHVERRPHPPRRQAAALARRQGAEGLRHRAARVTWAFNQAVHRPGGIVDELSTLTYEVDRADRARSRSNRPERGNGITLEMPRRARGRASSAPNLDPEVHVIALSGNGKGFCGGYDLVASAEAMTRGGRRRRRRPPGSPLDPAVQARQPRSRRRPGTRWSTTQMMSRNVRGFMSLFHSDKPVVCKVHGFCVAGGTDMALCSRPARDRGPREDRLSAGARLGRADDRAVGPPHRRSRRRSACCSPATACPGTEAVEWGLATECRAARRARRALRDAARARSRACRSTSS